MATEIERKFLVLNENWRDHVYKSVHYRQGYMNSNEHCSIRVRVSNQKASINIKSATLGITRCEYDYEIPLSEANEILDTLCDRPLIEKTRYFVKHHYHIWEIDVFDGDNDGLVVAEVELGNIDESITLPDWVGTEVSHDPRYYNVCLVNHPYKDWDEVQQAMKSP